MNETLSAALGYMLKCLAFITFYAQPTYSAMFAIVVLVLVDWGTGIWAAKKRGEKITSWGWRRTINAKIVPYQIGILCSHLVDINIFAGTLLEPIQLMKATAAFIAGAELKSIFENLGSISGLDFWSFLREKLKPAVKETPKD